MNLAPLSIAELCEEWLTSWRDLQAPPDQAEHQVFTAHEKLQRHIFAEINRRKPESMSDLCGLLAVCAACLDRPGWEDLSAIPLLRMAATHAANLGRRALTPDP